MSSILVVIYALLLAVVSDNCVTCDGLTTERQNGAASFVTRIQGVYPSDPLPDQLPQRFPTALTTTVPPPIIIDPLPTFNLYPISQPIPPPATPRPSDQYGWQRAESVALVQVTGTWTLRHERDVSAGAYHITGNAGAILRLPFEGDGVRVGYLAHQRGGVFEVIVDGVSHMTINSASDGSDLYAYQLEPLFFEPGYHVLDIVAHVPGDGSQLVAIDYVDIFNGPPLPEMPERPAPIIDTVNQRIVLADVRLVATPEVELAATPIPQTVLTVEVVVGYDLNTNGQIEPTEGVRDLSIRVVDARDNTLLASARTDISGFVRVPVMASGDVVALIPLLGQARVIRRGAGTTTWTVRLDPANVPGLIP